jgi:fatty acid desaturase
LEQQIMETSTDAAAGSTGGLKPLKRLMPCGSLSGRSWELAKGEQAQRSFGFVPVFRGAASQIGVVLILAATAWMWRVTGVWSLAVMLPAAMATAIIYRGLECLVHGAAHDDVCPRNSAVNDLLADFLFAYATGQSVASFREKHMAQHHSLFGSVEDPCRGRMQNRRDVGLGRLPTVRETLIAVPMEAVDFYRTVGTKPHLLARAVTWQLLAVYLPVALIAGPWPALIAYVGVMPLGLGVLLHVVRALGEAGEHDYRLVGSDSILERTYDNVGFLNGLIHPFGDGWHILHHLAPRIPQARLGKTMKLLVSTDPAFAALAQRRKGILSDPETYAATQQVGPEDLASDRAAPGHVRAESQVHPKGELV